MISGSDLKKADEAKPEKAPDAPAKGRSKADIGVMLVRLGYAGIALGFVVGGLHAAGVFSSKPGGGREAPLAVQATAADVAVAQGVGKMTLGGVPPWMGRSAVPLEWVSSTTRVRVLEPPPEKK